MDKEDKNLLGELITKIIDQLDKKTIKKLKKINEKLNLTNKASAMKKRGNKEE